MCHPPWKVPPTPRWWQRSTLAFRGQISSLFIRFVFEDLMDNVFFLEDFLSVNVQLLCMETQDRNVSEDESFERDSQKKKPQTYKQNPKIHLPVIFSQRENQDFVDLQFFRRELSTHKVNGICVRVCSCIHTCEKNYNFLLVREKSTQV